MNDVALLAESGFLQCGQRGELPFRNRPLQEQGSRRGSISLAISAWVHFTPSATSYSSRKEWQSSRMHHNQRTSNPQSRNAAIPDQRKHCNSRMFLSRLFLQLLAVSRSFVSLRISAAGSRFAHARKAPQVKLRWADCTVRESVWESRSSPH